MGKVDGEGMEGDGPRMRTEREGWEKGEVADGTNLWRQVGRGQRRCKTAKEKKSPAILFSVGPY